MARRAPPAIAFLVFAAAGSAPAAGAPSATLVASGLDSITSITNVGAGSGRLFLTLRGGTIRVWDGTQILTTPFLDIGSLVSTGGSEQGLLGLAFHPSYGSNGFFYVDYTNVSGDTVVARYTVSIADPNVADPPSAATILTVPQPFDNHNGGQLQFGPDGYLYIAMGDGGSGGDPSNNGQRLDTLLGKLLRIDVDAAFPYGIPPDNPFATSSTARHEIWDYGLRNPWRFSFDRGTGDLFIGDVGQDSREEVDHEPAGGGGGRNYGWRRMEGTACYNPPTNCNDGTLTLPILEYTHAAGCAITGGYRYRGAVVSTAGVYVYGDFCSGTIWGAVPDNGGAWSAVTLLQTSYLISTFGEDEAGELYFADYSGGALYRLAFDTTSISVANVAVLEGNSGTTPAALTVTLSDPNLTAVTVNYATANGTAAAGSDYTATSGTLTFAPGETTKTIAVPVLGDTLDEVDETFFVNLTSPTNATIADGQGLGTIRDDDGPTISINDRSVTEGNSGSLNVGFTVSLSAASTQTVSVNYATASGSATAGSDYTAKAGTLSFSPGQTSKTVTIAILGDTIPEPTETFVVNLTSPVNATIAKAQGVGTILDNDLAESLVWMNQVGVSAAANSLSKTETTGWNAGAVSRKFIASGDGYVEFTATETNTARMAGLGNGDASQNYTDIEYAIYTRADGVIQVYESGASRGGFGSYLAGDRFQVGVEAGVVKYRRNGTVFYTSTVAPTYPLLLDSALYTTGATITNATLSGDLQETASWTDVVGVSATGSSLGKTGTTGWNAGAVSTKAIASGDGYVEFTATETTTARMAGLGNGDASQNYTDIEYAIYTRADGIIQVFESGTSRGGFGSYLTGDRFRVGVESGVVKYRRNGTVFYTSALVPTYPLVLDTALYTTGATITNATLSGDLQETASWTDVVGVSATGSSLGKTGTTGWNAGAVSTKAIASGDGYVEFTATETTTARMGGLGNGDASQNYTDIEYAIYTRADGSIQVYESGTSRGGFGSYMAGDRFRVGIESGVVKYRRNGTVFYSSAVAPAYPLVLDTALYTTGATITNAGISGTLQHGASWISLVSVSASANSLTRVGANGWNAGAVSAQSLASGDGFVEFTATETNTYRMCGLGNGNASASYTDIEYAIDARGDGTVQVWEAGTSRGGFGSYAPGDRFRVSIESGVVKYRKNGTVFYTSTVTPTYPLLVDSSLYTTGATLTNVVITGPWQ